MRFSHTLGMGDKEKRGTLHRGHCTVVPRIALAGDA